MQGTLGATVKQCFELWSYGQRFRLLWPFWVLHIRLHRVVDLRCPFCHYSLLVPARRRIALKGERRLEDEVDVEFRNEDSGFGVDNDGLRNLAIRARGVER